MAEDPAESTDAVSGAGGEADGVLLSCPDVGLPLVHRGKVREVFDLGEYLLLVATDRLSAFDVVFAQGIPGKGRVLTRLSTLWFGATAGIARHHLVRDGVDGLGIGAPARALLAGRSMVVQRARRIDVECVVRGYLAGSAWKEYRGAGTACGVALPAGLRMNERLPEPIFTPALKNDVGHDENVSFGALAARVGRDLAGLLRAVSLRLYGFAAERCAAAGILLADTKFEFGYVNGELTLIDEVFTPDSSRFWPADRHRVGEPIDSLDKQPIRDYVASIGWNLEPPAPALPPAVVAAAAARYQDALRRIEGALRGVA